MCSKVKDFLTDDDFINYALGVTPEAVSQWETYFMEHPEQIADAEEAKAVLLAPADVTCDFSLVDNQNLKDRIASSISYHMYSFRISKPLLKLTINTMQPPNTPIII